MYVLPYGQMSLWGATVITNLMSAIPWVGQDIVESKNITEYYWNIVCTTNNILPTIGLVSIYTLKKGEQKYKIRQKRISFYSFILYSFLAGIIDGDGYIQITRTRKGFITIKLIISIQIFILYSIFYLY